jgi:transcription elongation factor SPT6
VLTKNQIGAIFGDLDELLAVRKQEIQRHAITFVKSTGNRLEDEFEPLILSMKHIP